MIYEREFLALTVFLLLVVHLHQALENEIAPTRKLKGGRDFVVKAELVLVGIPPKRDGGFFKKRELTGSSGLTIYYM